MFRTIKYIWEMDKADVFELAEKVATAHGWPQETAKQMTEVVGPQAATKMVEMAVAWRTGQIPDTSKAIIAEIREGQWATARELGMSRARFDRTFQRIYGERLRNPANAYHMVQSMAQFSPTYGPFLEAIPRAKCMLFTRGVSERLDGDWGTFGVNGFGGNVGLDDPSIVWCQFDTGCRFDRDRGEMLLADILEGILRADEPVRIFVYGAGYLTEMFCPDELGVSWMDKVLRTGKRVEIYACDQDYEVEMLRVLWRFCPQFKYRVDVWRQDAAGWSTFVDQFSFGRSLQESQVELTYFPISMSDMKWALKGRGIKPMFVIAKGVMSYNLTKVWPCGYSLATDVVADTYGLLEPGGSIRFDFQLKHAVNLRNGLAFGWGFPIGKTMIPKLGGIRLMVRDELEEWLDELKKAIRETQRLEVDDELVEVEYIRDDLGDMTAVIRLTKEK